MHLVSVTLEEISVFPNLRSADITSTRKWQPLAQLCDPLLPFFLKMDVTLWSSYTGIHYNRVLER
jgi:hypothetical protein